LKDRHAGTHGLNVTVRGALVELDGSGQIYFSDESDVSAVKNCRILKRLVFTFSHRDEDEAEVLSEIIGGRANQVPNIFDKEEIKLAEMPFLQRSLDHTCFEVTERSGSDLLDRSLTAGKAEGIVLGCEISHKSGDTIILSQPRKHFFQKHCLAGTGTGYEANDKNTSLAELRTQSPRYHIILLEDVLSNFD
jgi:hypothetical protein